ncbi:hypothetical protein GIB67_035016, partial [Kingdonia uniflora]
MKIRAVGYFLLDVVTSLPVVYINNIYVYIRVLSIRCCIPTIVFTYNVYVYICY